MSAAVQMPTSSRKIWLTTILKATLLTGAIGLFGLHAEAQLNASLYGTGVLGGSNACGYQIQVGDEAQSTLDDMSDKKKDIERIDQDIKDKTSDLKDANEKLREAKRNFYDSGYRESGDIGSMVTRFIESNKTCASVVSFDPAPATTDTTTPAPAADGTPNKGSVAGTDGGRKDNHAGATDPAQAEKDKQAAIDAKKKGDERKLQDAKPLNADQFKSVCSEPEGTINDHICDDNFHFEGSVGRDLDPGACRTSLKDWEDAQKEAKRLHDEVDVAKKLKASETRKLQSMNKKANREIGDYLKEQASGGQSEGDVCYTCLLQGNSGAARPQQNTGAEVLAQLGLGVGSMIIGGQTDRYNAKTAAMLGYQYQTTPSFAYGFPYFMGAMYGAINGGMSSGGFGCGGTIGGGGSVGGNVNGMLSPLGLAGLGGNVGGAFGYPQSMYPNSYGGGMFNPGMGSWGQNGPWGLGGNGMGNGMGNGIYGAQNPYGMGMGNGNGMGNGMFGSPYGNMGGGFNLGGMGNGMPYGMGNGYGSPFGNLGGGANIGGMPYNGMGNGMGNGYGSPYGNLGGGFNLGGGSPYGMPSMYSPYGNQGSFSPYMNNGMGNNNMLGMQQYQMQMQQYQQQMQMQYLQQQRYQQAQVAGQQVVGQLYQQIQSLYGQIQSVQASLQTYGTIPSYNMGPVNGSGSVGVGIGVGIGTGYYNGGGGYYNGGGYYQGGGSIAPAGSIINNGQTNPVTNGGPNIR